MNPKHVFMYLFFRKEIENPYYINIDIPDTEEKIGNAAQNLLQHRAEVIDCADICNIGTVLSLDKAQRSAFDDAVTGVAEEEVGVGIKVDTVILSQVHILRNPIDLQKAANHNIRTAQSSDIKSDSPTDDPNSQRILLKWPHNFLGTLGKTQN